MIRRYLSAPLRLIAAASLVLLGTAALGILGAYQYLRPSLPDVSTIKDIRLQVPLRVYTRDGRLIAQFGEQRRIPLPYEAMPNQLINALRGLKYHDLGDFEVNYAEMERWRKQPFVELSIIGSSGKLFR